MTQLQVITLVISCLLCGIVYSNIEVRDHSLADEVDEDLEYENLEVIERDLI